MNSPFNVAKLIAATNTKIDKNTTINEVLNNTQMSSIPINAINEGELLDAQEDIANELEAKIRKHRIVMNSSEAGSGKTHVTVTIAKRLGLDLFIFCPKGVINSWWETAKQYGVRVISITNLEMARGSDNYVKWYDMRNGYTDTATICPWIRKTSINNTTFKFVYNIPYKCLIVIDEQHYAKNVETINFALVKGATHAVKNSNLMMMLLTATPIEKVPQLKSIMYILGLINTPSMAGVKTYFNNRIGGLDLTEMHTYLYHKENGVIASMVPFRPYIEEYDKNGTLYKRFITNDVLPITYEMDKLATQNIIEANKEIATLRTKIGNKTNDHSLGEMNANRRLIEIYKIPKMVELAITALTEKRGDKAPFKRVTIFTNYIDSVVEIQSRIQNELDAINSDIQVETIYGNQKRDDMDAVITRYREGKTRIVVATISKAGTGVNLHDIRGDLETFVIISPPTSATLLIQAIRRHYRTKVRSDITQVIVFTKGDTFEESIRDALVSKMNDISNFTIGKKIEFDLDALALHYATPEISNK